jgi:oligosaccharide repeat unit polymerase
MFTYSLIGGGRTAFLVFFMALLFSLFLCRDIFYRKHKIVLSKFTYIFILFFGIVSYATMSFLTAFILDGDFTFNMDSFLYGSGEFNKTFITYSILPFRLFDYGLSNNYLDNIGYQYGLSTLDGLNRYMAMFLNRINIKIPIVSETTTMFFQDTWIRVGKDTVANYAYTNAMYHYLDFGVFGIFLFPFLFGLFFRVLIKRFYVSFSVPLYCLLFYLFYVLIHTVFSWHINKVYALGFVIIMTYYSFRKHRLNNRNN